LIKLTYQQYNEFFDHSTDSGAVYIDMEMMRIDGKEDHHAQKPVTGP
jgi:hypothetical protein